MSRVLVIGDLHCPVTHLGYLSFCRDLGKQYQTDTTVLIGDVVDWHAISFHDKEPQCPSSWDEYQQTRKMVQRWHRAFPNALVTIGNHDQRPARLAKTVNIPEVFLKDYNTLWGTSTWRWEYHTVIDDVYYCHGTGTTGVHPAWTKSGRMLMSVVMGHCHSRAGVKWRVNPMKRVFAMDVGCGVDQGALSMVYGREYDDKPILAAAVVLDGEPIHVMMPCGKGEKYHRSRFKDTPHAS